MRVPMGRVRLAAVDEDGEGRFSVNRPWMAPEVPGLIVAVAPGGEVGHHEIPLPIHSTTAGITALPKARYLGESGHRHRSAA